MSYAILHHGFWANPKVALAGNEAAGMFARSLSYCAEHLTDGYVSDEIAAFLGRPKLREKLVFCGLWERVSEGDLRVVSRRKGEPAELVMPGSGFFIRDYVFFNGTKEEVRALQAKKAAAGKAGADSRWHGIEIADAMAGAMANVKAPAKQVLWHADSRSNGTDAVTGTK